jgi:hypothetical protein
MNPRSIDRRHFLGQVTAGFGGLATTLAAGCGKVEYPEVSSPIVVGEDYEPKVKTPYTGPNVILVRFGGGVRRLETIQEPEKTLCPFIYQELYQKRGILFNNMEIMDAPGIETNHSQCTLYMLTGRYDQYEDINHKPFTYRFEPKGPMVFEYFRKMYDVPEHQTLIINCEDRVTEDFYTHCCHPQFGVRYRNTVLSLFRFRHFLAKDALKNPNLSAEERKGWEAQLRKLDDNSHYRRDLRTPCPAIDEFWEKWARYYGHNIEVHPRGDRLLTSLARFAIKELRPRLMLINYNDPDFVHWGPAQFYTRAISVIDEGVRELYEACQNDRGDGQSHTYRDNTVFLVVPDCGRDTNRCMPVPFQHHFGSKTSREIFAIAAGPGIVRSATPVDRVVQQISVAATIGAIMKFPTPHADAGALEEMLS